MAPGFRHLALVVAFATVAASFAVAQNPAPSPAKLPRYGTPGLNPAPKVAVAWNRYHDYEESTAILRELAEKHPEFCKLESLGKSHEGREMWLATITSFARGPIEQRPAFWIDAGIHANEIQATEVALYTAWYLLENRERVETVRRLLDERVFYVVPMMSPDSRDAHFHEANSTHTPRTGQRPFDDDKDGLVDEDKADDIDGDGHITQMRVKDPNGRYKVHPEFPELMVDCKPDERGQYTLLGTEGIDNDGDGDVNEDGDGYYDPNRDWAWGWQPGYVQFGAIRYPLAVAENRMVAEFVASRPHIAGAQSYHNAGGMILRGPGLKSESYHPDDVAVYDALAKPGEKMLPGYRYLVTAFDLYEVNGGEIEWMHETQGIFGFTNELFTPFNYFRKAEGGGYFGDDESIAAFDKRLLLGDGTTPWKEFDHPLYGKIEVGGMKKSWLRQPPSFLLEEECHRNACFTLWHADQMPQVRVQSARRKDLGGGLWEVTAIVENPKYIPTHSHDNLLRKITPPDEVLLLAADATGPAPKAIAVLMDDEPFFKEPATQKRHPHKALVPNLPSHGVKYVRWIVADAAPARVEIRSVKGGRHSAPVEDAK